MEYCTDKTYIVDVNLKKVVLILILLEYCTDRFRAMRNIAKCNSLNPYSFGILHWCTLLIVFGVLTLGLNPYSFGILHWLYVVSLAGSHVFVLILILLEYCTDCKFCQDLRRYTSCLNPYSFGILHWFISFGREDRLCLCLNPYSFGILHWFLRLV